MHTVKYADDLVLQTKEKQYIQGMIDGLIEVGKGYGMENKFGKN